MLKESLSTYHHAEISSSNFVLEQCLASSGLIGDLGGWYFDGEAYLNKGLNIKNTNQNNGGFWIQTSKEFFTFYQNSQGLTVIKTVENHWRYSKQLPTMVLNLKILEGDFPDRVRKLETRIPAASCWKATLGPSHNLLYLCHFGSWWVCTRTSLRRLPKLLNLQRKNWLLGLWCFENKPIGELLEKSWKKIVTHMGVEWPICEQWLLAAISWRNLKIILLVQS